MIVFKRWFHTLCFDFNFYSGKDGVSVPCSEALRGTVLSRWDLHSQSEPVSLRCMKASSFSTSDDQCAAHTRSWLCVFVCFQSAFEVGVEFTHEATDSDCHFLWVLTPLRGSWEVHPLSPGPTSSYPPLKVSYRLQIWGSYYYSAFPFSFSESPGLFAVKIYSGSNTQMSVY